MEFDDFEDQLKDAVREHVRGNAEDFIMEHARAVQAEMGAEAENLQFHYTPSDDQSLESIGNLNVSGAPDAVLQEFHRRLRERFGNN